MGMYERDCPNTVSYTHFTLSSHVQFHFSSSELRHLLALLHSLHTIQAELYSTHKSLTGAELSRHMSGYAASSSGSSLIRFDLEGLAEALFLEDGGNRLCGRRRG